MVIKINGKGSLVIFIIILFLLIICILSCISCSLLFPPDYPDWLEGTWKAEYTKVDSYGIEEDRIVIYKFEDGSIYSKKCLVENEDKRELSKAKGYKEVLNTDNEFIIYSSSPQMDNGVAFVVFKRETDTTLGYYTDFRPYAEKEEVSREAEFVCILSKIE